MALPTIWRPSLGCSSSHSASFSFVARSTAERISVLPSLALVCPSNCGLRSFTETIAVSPSRMSSPSRLSSLSFSMALGLGVLVQHVGDGLLEAFFVHSTFGGRDVVRERVQALVVAGVPLHRDLGLRGRSPLFVRRSTRLNRGSFDDVEVLDEVDDAARELEALLERRAHALVAEADLEARLRKAISRRRSMRVWARKSVSSKTAGSGQNVTSCRASSTGRPSSSRPWGTPPFA